jgi:short subunit fatty acids transporter
LLTFAPSTLPSLLTHAAPPLRALLAAPVLVLISHVAASLVHRRRAYLVSAALVGCVALGFLAFGLVLGTLMNRDGNVDVVYAALLAGGYAGAVALHLGLSSRSTTLIS